MEGEPIYMRVGNALYPEYSKFVDEKGNLYTEMLKPMYGCIQASLLWYRLLVKVLKDIGFQQCEVDLSAELLRYHALEYSWFLERITLL
jgi:hypothetical protein